MRLRHDMITVFVVRPDERERSHEFLQLLRIHGDYMGESWQIIRGGVEPGETYIAAALRELREESGLVPREFYRLGLVETFYTEFEDTIWHAVPFCAIVGRDQPVVLNDEHVDHRWIHADQIESLMMWGSERALLPDLFRDILSDSLAKPLLRIPLDSA